MHIYIYKSWYHLSTQYCSSGIPSSFLTMSFYIPIFSRSSRRLSLRSHIMAPNNKSHCVYENVGLSQIEKMYFFPFIAAAYGYVRLNSRPLFYLFFCCCCFYCKHVELALVWFGLPFAWLSLALHVFGRTLNIRIVQINNMIRSIYSTYTHTQQQQQQEKKCESFYGIEIIPKV